MKPINFFALIVLTIPSLITAEVITNAEIRDLQLLETYAGRPGLIPLINKTITSIGKDCFKNRVLNPTNNTGLLIGVKWQSGKLELLKLKRS